MFSLIACGSNEEGADTGGAQTSPTQGVTDTEIRLGTLVPLSGNPAAAWGIAISKGEQAYFDYVNDNGGIYGRKIKLIVGDNQYAGPVASEAVRKLVEQDGVFALMGSIGTEAHTAVYQYLEEHGIPDMFLLIGESKFTVPVVRSRFTELVDYVTEGRIFATYVSENYNGKKVGLLVQNDEAGKEGEKGVRQGIDELGADTDITVEYYDTAQSDVTSQVQRLKTANVDVIVFLGGPVQAANMIKNARETMSWDVPMAISSVNAIDLMASLAGMNNVEGVVSATIGHQAWETDIPGIMARKKIMAQYAPVLPFDNLSLSGYAVAENMVMVLKQAGRDLTTDSFLNAAESICNFTSDISLTPSTTSPEDHRFLEGEILVRATVDRSVDPPAFRWEPFGDVVNFESTKDCERPTPPAGAEDQPGASLQGN